MQLLEVKNNIAKIVYNPAENHLLLLDFLIIEDINQKLIAQIINIYTTNDSNNNMADVILAAAIDKNNNLSYYNGYIPVKSAKVAYINPNGILELFKGDENIYLGNLSNHPECFVKPSLSFINDKVYIQSDRPEKTKIVIQNIIYELYSKQKKVVLVDFDGSFSKYANFPQLKISKNFKLPLNINALNNILEYDVTDCPVDDKAIIQSIILELREYINTTKNKFLPFTSFKNVVDNEYNTNPISGLMLLKNNLWLYAQENIFAENKLQFELLNTMLEKHNFLIIDASNINEKWYKFTIQTVTDIINKDCYLILSLNDIPLDKKYIVNLYNKQNITPVISTSYDCEYRQILKSVCKNQILLKPLNIIKDEETYIPILNKLNSNELILYGESTLFLPLILNIKTFNSSTSDEVLQDDIKKDVDKFFYPAKKMNISLEENNSDKEEIKQNKVYDEDFNDSDFEFLEEQNNEIIPIDEIRKNKTAALKNQYDVFNPVPSNEQEEEFEKISCQDTQLQQKTNEENIDDMPLNVSETNEEQENDIENEIQTSTQEEQEKQTVSMPEILQEEPEIIKEDIDDISLGAPETNEEQENNIENEIQTSTQEEQEKQTIGMPEIQKEEPEIIKEDIDDISLDAPETNEEQENDIENEIQTSTQEEQEKQTVSMPEIQKEEPENTEENIDEMPLDVSDTNEDENLSESDSEITPLDEVIDNITAKINENDSDNENTIEMVEEEQEKQKEQEPEYENESKSETIIETEPPSIKKEINIKETPELTVYETDNSSEIQTDDIPFKIGDRVHHPKYGNGIIKGFANYSNKILFFQIEFEHVGRRMLDPKISDIQKIE